MAQLAAVVLLLVLAVPALATAHEFSGTPYEYSDEVAVDYVNASAVSEGATVAEGYGADPTVTVDGVELVRGTDYRWNASAGSIAFEDTANTSAGATAWIEYAAYQRTPQSALAWTIISPFMALFGLFALVASVRTLWSYVSEVWDLV